MPSAAPIGRRNGGLAGVHPADLLAGVLRELVDRTGIDPSEVGQVVGGCVSQVGEQSFDVTRTAWLTAGLPMSVAATTVDTQCGSSQQATNLATALVAGGVVDVAVACGVESMSRIPIGSNSSKRLGFGVPIPKSYFEQYEFTSQFEGAERIAERWGVTRADCDEFGLLSQQRAATAWDEGRFDRQVVPVEAPDLDDDGAPTGSSHRVGARRGSPCNDPREARIAEAGRPGGRRAHRRVREPDLRRGRRSAGDVGREGGLARADAAGHDRGHLPRRGRPGPDAHRSHRCARGTSWSAPGMTVDDVDLFEINEAFASVVLAWARESVRTWRGPTRTGERSRSGTRWARRARSC